MATILDQIVASKQEEIRKGKAANSLAALKETIAQLTPPRPFLPPLSSGSIRLIAEIKQKSPSVPQFRSDFDPLAIAKTYATHGAAAISVLTDTPFFGGSLALLTKIRSAVPLPVLRKDFILDPWQIYEARAHGADAVLLIVSLLSQELLCTLLAETEALGMAALVEVHNQEELMRALKAPTRLLGINNRDLATFTCSLDTTFRLLTAIPPARRGPEAKHPLTIVSESGIRTREEIVALQTAGVHATLIGETLLRTPDLPTTLHTLFPESAL